LADGILLERAGRPAVSICTDPFVLGGPPPVVRVQP
jgi:hypothetical protein